MRATTTRIATHPAHRSSIRSPASSATRSGSTSRVAAPPGDPTGSTSGQGVDNLPLQSYTDRFSEYQSAALDSLDRLVIPTALQDLVRQYFTELEP